MLGENISIKNKALLISFILMFFFLTAAVCAQEEGNATVSEIENNDTIDVISSDEVKEVVELKNESVAEIAEDSQITANSSSDNATSEIVKTSFKSDTSAVVKGKYFEVSLLDDNGMGLAKKTVTFSFNGVKSKVTTNSKGVAKLKINAKPKTYTIKYSFKQKGYQTIIASKKILVVPTSASKIKASNYVAYVGFKNTFSVTLLAGTTPITARAVEFKLNGKTFTKKTNGKGKVSFNIGLKKGNYNLKYSYAGEKNIKKTSGKVKVKVIKGMPVKIIRANSPSYRHLTSAPFKIQLKDARGNVVANQKVIITFNKKKHVVKTNGKGIATVKVRVKMGDYTFKVVSSKTSIYKKASKSFKVYVGSKFTRNNGFWLLSSDMKSVDLNKMAKYHVKHIFLNAKAIEKFGRSGVQSFIKKAKAHGIKVHIWMQIFYSVKSGWVSPVNGDGSFKYSLLNSKINQAKSYAKIKGVAGVHFDYLRFPGDAHNHKNGIKAINYFTKKASGAVHKINSKLIVSAAVMPEPSSMKYYYGQDIPTLSKYLNAIIPMVYKGNYHASSAWIKKTTQIFTKQSKKAKIWTGLQTYRSDENTAKISAGELMNDAKSASLGGAYGVVLFRYGLINYFDFNRI